MVWDAYKCHTSEATRNETKKMKLHTAVIPGGCTKYMYIQAPDVVWNASFKSHLRSSYDAWLSKPSLHEYTKGGNMKPPSRFLLCKWIKLLGPQFQKKRSEIHSFLVPSQQTRMEATITRSIALKQDNHVEGNWPK